MIPEPIPHFLAACKLAGDLDEISGWYRVWHGVQALNVMASNGGGWDHVSVSTSHRCPTWEEMEYVRGLFFRPSETVMQLSVPRSRHISIHPYCLHLWRPQDGQIPLPPPEFV